MTERNKAGEEHGNNQNETNIVGQRYDHDDERKITVWDLKSVGLEIDGT